MQVEIEKNSKALTELESETSNSRNQLTSLDSQKMKLVQEGNSSNRHLFKFSIFKHHKYLKTFFLYFFRQKYPPKNVWMMKEFLSFEMGRFFGPFKIYD